MPSQGLRARSFRTLLLFLSAVTALFAASSCGDSKPQLARRILDRHRKSARVKPLPASQVVRLRLSSSTGSEGAGEIRWEGARYRETFSSGGLSTVKGIQADRAYYTDVDGVTRVASDPVLAELRTSFYFWRRAYLFEDLQGARITVGPADDATVSIRLTPRGGNLLRLTFSRRDHRLVSAQSPGLDLIFESPPRFRDASRGGEPVAGEIAGLGLPTGSLPDATVGGWSSRWGGALSEAPFDRLGSALVFHGRVSAADARIALDAAADGPLLLSRGLSDQLGLRFQTDAWGREVTKGVRLEIGGLSYPALSAQRSDRIPNGADAVAGAALFRETVVEIDSQARHLRFHDPEHWVPPGGFFRIVLDDDGDRPVAILRKGKRTLRLLAGAVIDGPLVLAPATAARLADEANGKGSTVEGLRWGGVRLPPLPVRVQEGVPGAEWGDDGKLGHELLLQFHTFIDMPHRWIYLKPVENE